MTLLSISQLIFYLIFLRDIGNPYRPIKWVNAMTYDPLTSKWVENETII